VCTRFAQPLAYVFLGAGDDRLTVKADRGVGPAAKPATAAPDGLAGIPSDEGEGGSFLGWRIEGGPGRDRIVGSPFFDDIIGGPGSDVLYGRGGDDLFVHNGEAGTDKIFGGEGHNALSWASPTPLRIDLESGMFNGGSVDSIDKVRGGEGNDILIGSDRPELLQGAGGADAIAGRGGADLLIGDGLYVLAVASDAIDAGAGDDLVDLSNEVADPAGLLGPKTGPPPTDRVRCADGNDRVDTTAAQLVPTDCEGARFKDATTTVALRPFRRPDGALVFDIPCPKINAIGRTIGVCEGTLTLTRFTDRTPLAATRFTVGGGTHSPVVVRPSSPVTASEAVAVQIAGTFDHPVPDNSVLYGLNAFAFGWATTF
jgi:Ca2+-binding RTX toxin-like protein